jgi:hypothetical protein
MLEGPPGSHGQNFDADILVADNEGFSVCFDGRALLVEIVTKSTMKYFLCCRWMAPESIRTRRFSNKSDVYSFGILLWEMWSGGSYPFMLISSEEEVASR